MIKVLSPVEIHSPCSQKATALMLPHIFNRPLGSVQRNPLHHILCSVWGRLLPYCEQSGYLIRAISSR